MLALFTIVSVWISIVTSKSPFTTEIFTEFKRDVILLLTCDDGEDPNCPGLTFDHPDVTQWDTLSGTNADKMLIPGMIRLAFHDCAEINPELVAQGKSKPFTSQYSVAGGCNGCINLDNPDNGNLLDGSILPFEDLCLDYSDYISRADCWALAATIASEHSAQLLSVNQGFPFFQDITPSVVEGDIPYFYGRSDCVTDSEKPYQNPSDSYFVMPVASQGWSHTADFFKTRFGWGRASVPGRSCEARQDGSDKCTEYFNNRDIISLLTASHSVGRGHEQISGFSGQWDFSEDTLDNNWISTMFNEDFMSTNFGAGIPVPGSCGPTGCAFFQANQNWNQSTINIGFPQFGVLQNDDILGQFPETRLLDPPLNYMMTALNTDMSMLFDLSWYLEHGRAFDMDCNSHAASICPEGSTIITAQRSQNPDFTLFNIGKSGAELGEVYACPAGDNNCCDKIQCPIQCEGGITEFNRLIDGDLIDTLAYDHDCPAAIAKKYSNKNSRDNVFPNRQMGLDYAKAFTKMITIGYYDRSPRRWRDPLDAYRRNGLKVVGDEDGMAANILDMGYGSMAMYSLIVVIAMITLFCLCVCGYCVYQKQRTKFESSVQNMVDGADVGLTPTVPKHKPVNTTDGASFMTDDKAAGFERDCAPIDL